MGGVQAVQTATIVFALPFAGVMLLAIALWRGVRNGNAASAHCASACARWWTHPGGNRSQASACASAWPVRRCTNPCASRLTTP